MKKILFAITFICLGSIAMAQKVFFIYLQSEKQTPFFVKMGDKVHSSTASGYLILSSLKDSVYVFTIGYPGIKAGESKFSVAINNKDHGFLIKNLEDGPGLFDLQTLSVTKPLLSSTRNGGQQTVRTDAFTKLLSRATDDASLLFETVKPVETIAVTEKPKEKKKEVEVEKMTPPPVETNTASIGSSGIDETNKEIAKVEETKIDQGEVIQKEKASAIVKEKELDEKISAPTKKEIVTNDEPVDSIKQQATPIEKPIETTAIVKETEREEEMQEKKPEIKNTSPEIQNTPYKRSVITRRSESSTTEGFGLVFIDADSEVKDTIRILIPHPKKKFVEEEAVATQPKTSEPEIKEDVKPETSPNASTEQSKYVIACTFRASDKEFLKLRKNMASETNDERMILEAKKYFRNKCFTTEQVRSLSALFLTSASKYQFFDAAFTHVLDPAEFASLGLEIKDEYYLKRFKALIGE